MIKNLIIPTLMAYSMAILYICLVVRSNKLLVVYSELAGFVAVPVLSTTALLTQLDWVLLLVLLVFILSAAELILPTVLLKGVTKQ